MVETPRRNTESTLDALLRLPACLLQAPLKAFRTWRRNYDSFVNVCSLSMVAMSCWLKAEASTTNNSPILRYYRILLVGHLSCVTKISPV
jgi:hypothetical protein